LSQTEIVALYRYPVKGLTPERLESGVELTSGQPLPLDRVYAIENGPGGFDENAPRHLPKVAFLCLMRNERLAGLRTHFDEAGGRHVFTLTRNEKLLAEGALAEPQGRAAIESYFAREFASELRGRPRLVTAPGHSFSDVREKCLHIVNLASVRALEITLGEKVNPLRFRPNVVIDGLDAHAELDLIGRTLAIGGARLNVFKRTERCAATNVDPTSARRRGDLPGHLHATRGHRDFGVYATVTRPGRIAPGDEITIL